MSMPGMGPITAMAIEAFAPTMSTFRKGRDFAAWLGLVPKHHSSGGKQQLGRTIEDGPTRYPAASDHRRDDRDPMGMPQSPSRELMAGAYVGAQATHARCDRASQQDGSVDLGNDDEERELQGIRAGCGIANAALL